MSIFSMTMTAMAVVVMTGHTGLEYDILMSWFSLYLIEVMHCATKGGGPSSNEAGVRD